MQDDYEDYRVFLYEKVLARFGPEAAEDVKSRLRSATREELVAWARRAIYMDSYPELVEPGPLAVEVIEPRQVQQRSVGGPSSRMAVLLLFRRSREETDWRFLRESAPWLLDLPDFNHAFTLLRMEEWLLVFCGEGQRAGLLAHGTRESKRLVVRVIALDEIARAGMEAIKDRYIPWFW